MDKIKIKEDSLFLIKFINLQCAFICFLIFVVIFDSKSLDLPFTTNYIILYIFIIVSYLVITLDSLFIFVRTITNYKIHGRDKYSNSLYIEDGILYLSHCDVGNVSFNIKEILHVDLKSVKTGGTQLKIHRKKLERSFFDKLLDLYLKSYIIEIEIGELDKLLDLFDNYYIEMRVVRF